MSLRWALLVMAMSCLCRAESVCPWLNAATAGGILGAPVTAVVKPTSCEFVRRAGASESALHIEVQKKPALLAAKCGLPGRPLRAIGNEAWACGDGRSEMVIGRVRDQRFAVRISTGDGSADRAVLREKTRKLAEQVAGSLF